MRHFIYKKNIPLSYERQGYIYFCCKSYGRLPERQKQKIRDTAARECGPYAEPVMRFVTGDEGAAAICASAYISDMTLYRAVRRFYLGFPRAL